MRKNHFLSVFTVQLHRWKVTCCTWARPVVCTWDRTCASRPTAYRPPSASALRSRSSASPLFIHALIRFLFFVLLSEPLGVITQQFVWVTTQAMRSCTNSIVTRYFNLTRSACKFLLSTFRWISFQLTFHWRLLSSTEFFQVLCSEALFVLRLSVSQKKWWHDLDEQFLRCCGFPIN